MTSWHLDQLDKIADELDFIKAAADSLQVTADVPDDAVQPQSLSTMMLRILASAERCQTLVGEFRLPPSEIPSLSDNAETETGDGEAVDAHHPGDDQERPAEYDHHEAEQVFRESIGLVKATFDMLEAAPENGDPCLREGTLGQVALAGFRAAKVAEQRYDALATDYMSKREQLREIETTE